MNYTLSQAKMQWHRSVLKIHSKITHSCRINTNLLLIMVKKPNRTLLLDLIKLVWFLEANQVWWPITNTITTLILKEPQAKVTLNSPNPKNQQSRVKLKAPQFCLREHQTLNWPHIKVRRDWKSTKSNNKLRGWSHIISMQIQDNNLWLKKKKDTTPNGPQVMERSLGQGRAS